MTVRQELSSLIQDLTDVYEKLICMNEDCVWKETSKIIQEAIKNVDAELQKHKKTLKHFVENDPATIKEVEEERARDKEEFSWNVRIYEATLHE